MPAQTHTHTRTHTYGRTSFAATPRLSCLAATSWAAAPAGAVRRVIVALEDTMPHKKRAASCGPTFGCVRGFGEFRGLACCKYIGLWGGVFVSPMVRVPSSRLGHRLFFPLKFLRNTPNARRYRSKSLLDMVRPWQCLAMYLSLPRKLSSSHVWNIL